MRRKQRLLFTGVEGVQDGVNLTPLIDVVFIVLIMFILAAPLLDLDRIELAHGSTQIQENEGLKNDELVIYVHKDNSIAINKHFVSKENLESVLKALYCKSPRQIPKLIHDKEAFFGTYQLVKNAVENAGFETLDILLKQSE